MKNGLTMKNNRVMKNYMKYICLFLMLFGMSFGQKAWAYDITLYTDPYDNSTVTLSADENISAGTVVTITLNPPIDYYCPNEVEVVSEYVWYGIYYIDEDYDEDYSKVNNGVGNKQFSFTMPAYNVILYVSYKAVTSHTVTYYTPTCVDSPKGSKASQTRFPTPSSSSDLSAYKFEGWVTSSCSPTTTRPSAIYAAGEPIPDEVTSAYALYSSISSAFALTSSSPSSDSRYILSGSSNAASSNALINETATSSRIATNAIATTGNAITCTDWRYVWTFIQGTGDYSSYWYIYSEATGKYLAASGTGDTGSSDRKATLADAPSNNTERNKAAWSVSVSSGKITLTNKARNANSDTYKNLLINSDKGGFFGSGTNPYFFAQGATTTTYTTSPSCSTTYTVTYNANGATSGSVPTDNTEYDADATVTVKTNSGNLAKTGYTFSGWNTKANGTGTTYSAVPTLGTFTITENTTLYAKWVATEYTVTLNKDGGSGGSSSVTATYNAAMPSAGVAPTLSGYTFGGYYGSIAGGGTQYYNATPASAHVWDVADAATIYAKWTQTVTLNANGGAANKSVDVVLHGTGTSSFTAVTRSGYTCTGYWDNTSGGNLVIKTDGTLNTYSSDISGYINSSGQWCHSGATTLYAQWEANSYTVTFYKNDLSATGEMDAQLFEYGTAQNLSTCTFERTGYDFAGWATTSSGDKAYDDEEEVNNLTTTPDGNVDLYALWSIKSYNLTIGTPGNVTIEATPEGGSKMEEGDDDDVDYNTTITLAYDDVESGYFWGGWKVTDVSDNDITEDVMYDENTMFMPASNATVTAVLYTNAKAWCPVITLAPTDGVASPILVTSVGGQSVKAVRTLHLTVSGAATPAAEVTISGDDLEFYDGTTKITSSNLTCSSYALDKTITVAYKPTSYVNETWAEPDITVSCSGTEITVSDLVNARCLPDNGSGDGQGFVIAAKVGDEWLALPASMSAGAQDGLPITVDNSSDPTRATKAPTSARYNMYNVYTSTGANDRHKTYGTYAYLAGSGTKALKAAASGTNISLGANVTPGTYGGGAANPELIEWLLSTTDKKNYTLTNNGRSAQLKYYTTHGKFGMYTYGSQVITEFRLLPANFYTEAPMQVLEWKANSVVVMYTGSETTATTKVGSNSASSSQTLSTHKLTHGIYELTTDQALSSNDGAALEIAFGDGTTKKIVEIPLIITGATTATDGHAGQDVIICKNGKLTAASTKYDYFNIYVYGGGKLKIESDKSLGVNNIILRAGGISTNGSGGSATYEYVYPQVELGGTLTSTADSIQYEYITDYDHWYHLCLPFNAPLRSIHYPQEYYGDNVTAENSGSWIIKRYDGATRATGEYNAWKDIEKDDPAKTEVTAGYGYIFWGAPKKVSVGGAAKERQTWGIQRMTMSIAADEAKTAENADKNVTGLAAHSGAGSVNDQGWNLVGNPYMVNLTAFSSDNLKQGQLVHSDAVPWDGKWKNDGAGTRYVTIPNNHFDTYEAKTTATASGDGDFMPGRVFFVQIDKGTTLTFEATNRAALAPAWHRNTEAEQTVDIETGIVMSSETLADEVNFWIKDGKTEAYEFNADYPKTLNKTNFNIYGVHQSGNLSWVAISPAIAEGDMAIGYQVPAAGDYTLSLSEKYIAEEIESVFVTDHGVSPELTTDLMVNTYTFTVHQAETNNERFTVSIKVREKDNTPTDIGNSKVETHAVKFIRDDKMYILRNGLLYDATGKRVVEINK